MLDNDTFVIRTQGLNVQLGITLRQQLPERRLPGCCIIGFPAFAVEQSFNAISAKQNNLVDCDVVERSELFS